MVEAIEFLSRTTMKSAIDIFYRNGEVYVSRLGACRPDTQLLKGEKILDKRSSKDYIYPVRSKTEFKITKWPGGNHYYILENGNSIEIRGESKWKTAYAAQAALDRHWDSMRRRERKTVFPDK